MKVKYTLNYSKCYLGKIPYDFNLKILKRELNDNKMYEIIEINYNNNYDDIIKTLKESDSIIGIDILYKNEKIIIIRSTLKVCNLISAMKKYSNGNRDFENNETIDDKHNVWKISLENMDDIKMLGESLKKETGNNVSIKIEHGNAVKSESLFILKEAFDLGYFDVPKKINLIELSKTLNITPTKLNITIRTLLNHFLEESFY